MAWLLISPVWRAWGSGGDWMESLSALVEHTDGRLELLHWHPCRSSSEGVTQPMEASLMPADMSAAIAPIP